MFRIGNREHVLAVPSRSVRRIATRVIAAKRHKSRRNLRKELQAGPAPEETTHHQPAAQRIIGNRGTDEAVGGPKDFRQLRDRTCLPSG